MNETIEYFRITPEGTCLDALAASEIDGLYQVSREKIHGLLERCALAVLNCGSETDDVKAMLAKYSDFRLEVIRTPAEVEIELHNAPEIAFVTYESEEDDGIVIKRKIIEGIRQHIFAVLRDLVFIQNEIDSDEKFDLETSNGITDSIFLILRNAGIFEKKQHHKIIVCWGGHAIKEEEYQYSAEVGAQCGLRLMDVITGCGAGAMRGPMEGATIAHAKQRIKNGRYVGISEPGIISSEPPNPIVDPLVIMPDIEKRLEAFIRLGQGIIVFAGGVGTAEELMYILGVLSHEKNRDVPFPLILTGPESSREYFESLDLFLVNTFGESIKDRYKIILGEPEKVAQEMNKGLLQVKAHREKMGDSYYFNRTIHIPFTYQQPFIPTHENVSKLEVTNGQNIQGFAAALRCVFSAIVAGNVKPDGIKAVEDHGPFKINGEKKIMKEIDKLLASFVRQGRMRLEGEYKPCYTIVH